MKTKPSIIAFLALSTIFLASGCQTTPKPSPMPPAGQTLTIPPAGGGYSVKIGNSEYSARSVKIKGEWISFITESPEMEILAPLDDAKLIKVHNPKPLSSVGKKPLPGSRLTALEIIDLARATLQERMDANIEENLPGSRGSSRERADAMLEEIRKTPGATSVGEPLKAQAELR